MTAYYNENDPKAAAWLRELINRDLIAKGIVDERSISDVTPSDLEGYTQCHFFAGIGVWSHALRLAQWPDTRPVWTGSCPCQPFSTAGQGLGFADERHLWPHWQWLISQCRPHTIFGEQVASKDGLGWIDLVCADLEATGYASGAVDLCAAGVGAPHIRQRLWWFGTRLADAQHSRWQGGLSGLGQELGADGSGAASDNAGHSTTGSVADTDNARLEGRISGRSDQRREDQLGHARRCSAVGGLADSDGDRCDESLQQIQGGFPERFWGNDIVDGLADTSIIRRGEGVADNGGLRGGDSAEGSAGRSALNSDVGAIGRPCPTNGFWRDADWIFCRDGKFRPVKPGTSPLVDGSAARVVRLRGYGNAIVAQVAATFIEAFDEVTR